MGEQSEPHDTMRWNIAQYGLVFSFRGFRYLFVKQLRHFWPRRIDSLEDIPFTIRSIWDIASQISEACHFRNCSSTFAKPSFCNSSRSIFLTFNLRSVCSSLTLHLRTSSSNCCLVSAQGTCHQHIASSKGGSFDITRNSIHYFMKNSRGGETSLDTFPRWSKTLLLHWRCIERCFFNVGYIQCLLLERFVFYKANG